MNINTPSQGKIYANIAFVLADVLESCLLDANQNLRKENQEFKHESKREFNTAIASIRKIKSHINKCSENTQECFGDDSDTLYQTMLTLIDRCGEDDELMFKFYNYIKSFPSKLDMDISDSAFKYLIKL
jgi:hypothetical protein